MTPLEAITTALAKAAHFCGDSDCPLTETECIAAHPIQIAAWTNGTVTDLYGPISNIAEVALAAIQGTYVPPPPGSDRDKLPDHLLAAIDLGPYQSTGCHTAGNLASATTTTADPGLAAELLDWAARMHASCRITRKQDMARCQCPCHRPPGDIGPLSEKLPAPALHSGPFTR